MGLFSNRYDKPGPGVDRDEPRKKGIYRFFEICSRDFFDLVKLNFMFFVCCAPSVVLFIFFLMGFGGNYSIIFLPLSLAATFPIGGGIAACFFCITKKMRDDPGFIWDDFKRKFKENYIIAMPAGTFCAFVFYLQVYFLFFFSDDRNQGTEAWMIIVNVILLMILGMIFPYLFLQIPYLQLKPGKLVKNSLIFSFAHAPRSIMGLASGGAVWALYAVFFPISVFAAPLIIVFVFSLSWLLTLMWIWKPVDDLFKIEETLRNRKEEALSGPPKNDSTD